MTVSAEDLKRKEAKVEAIIKHIEIKFEAELERWRKGGKKP